MILTDKTENKVMTKTTKVVKKAKKSDAYVYSPLLAYQEEDVTISSISPTSPISPLVSLVTRKLRIHETEVVITTGESMRCKEFYFFRAPITKFTETMPLLYTCGKMKLKLDDEKNKELRGCLQDLWKNRCIENYLEKTNNDDNSDW